ncbi:MAG: Uma2 family endonuclease [Saprospiraceae bacterium]
MTATLVQSDYEIERGKPMPDKNHAIIQGRLVSRLDRLYENLYTILPEINLDLPTRERVPDLAIYPPLDFDPDNNEVRMSEPPLGAIEILSEMQNLSDLMLKRAEYFNAGVQSYWLVVPALRTVYVFYAPDDYDVFSRKDKLVDKKLGIELDLGEIFK